MIGSFLIPLALVLSGCTSPDNATKALEAYGYTDIQITGYDFFGCDSKDDDFHTGFTATENGHKVTGVVCAGLLKGQTIRIEKVD